MSALVEKNIFSEAEAFTARPDQPKGINASSAGVSSSEKPALADTSKSDQPARSPFKEMLAISCPKPA